MKTTNQIQKNFFDPIPQPLEVTYWTVHAKADWYGLKLVVISLLPLFVLEDIGNSSVVFKGASLQEIDSYLNTLER